MAYRAEIEIGVRGTRQLEELRSKINQSAAAADSLNETLGKQGRLAQSLGNYERLLEKAARTLKNKIAGTEGETKAIKEYVTILGQANEAQARQNGLIEREIALRNRLKDAGPRTALRAQERGIFVEETISRGRSARIARERSAYLQGPGRTADAERLAQLAAQESEERQKAFKARESYAKEIFNIERNFNKQIRENEVDNIMKTFKLEEDIQTRLFNKALDLDKKEGKAFDAELKRRTAAKEAAFEKERRIAEQVAESSPIGGAENIPGSPAFLRARARRRREAIGSGIIGGAFPLLFGQGIGAAVGGGLGGVAGGLMGGQFGFGLSLVGTAVGQFFDDIGLAAIKVGNSLADPLANFDELNEKFKLFDTNTTRSIKALVELGRAQEAADKIQQEIVKRVGQEGAADLQRLGEAATKLGDAWNELSLQLQALIAGPIADFLAKIAEALGASAKYRSAQIAVDELRERLPEQGQKRLDEQIRTLVRKEGIGRDPETLARRTQGLQSIVDKFSKEFGAVSVSGTLTPEQEKQNKLIQETLKNEVIYRKESVSLLGRELELLKMTGAENQYRKATLQAQLKVDQQRLAVRKATDAVNRAAGDVSAEISARKEQFTAADALKRAEAEAEVAREAERVFNLYNKQANALQEVVTEGKLRLQNEQAVAEARNKLTGAYYNAELKIKDLLIQRAKQRGDANAVLQLELDKVQLIYRQTIAQIQAEVERTRLKYRQVQLATKELEVANLRKKAEGKLQQADVDAMKVQQQALKIAGYNVSISEQVANQQIRGAQAVATASEEALRYAYNQNKAAAAAERTAIAQERAARAAGGAAGGDEKELVDVFPNPKLSFLQRGTGSGGIGYGISFAEGGYVTRPTKAIVGERGENEYVIPESKMRSSLERYARGARGESVVEGNGSSNGMGSRTARGNTTVNVSTGPVMRMGNKDYVTVADLNNAVGSVVATLSRDTSNKYGNSPRVS